jgi:sortase A
MIFEGAGTSQLHHGVGRLSKSALPGHGRTVLLGHRDGDFRALRNIRPGERITVNGVDKPYEYVVESTSIVNPSDELSLADANEPGLTLVTCYPFDFIGPAPKRFIVRAAPAD